VERIPVPHHQLSAVKHDLGNGGLHLEGRLVGQHLWVDSVPQGRRGYVVVLQWYRRSSTGTASADGLDRVWCQVEEGAAMCGGDGGSTRPGQRASRCCNSCAAAAT
jgi:hypothetical protein